jgi:thioredoxin reductase (NADPH)
VNEKRVENVIIVGGACAGYTAAVYTARAELEPLVIEGFEWGGQLQNTTEVENYPGFPEGIMGPELMQHFRAQAERFGTRFISDDATRIELSDGGVHRVWVGDTEHLARSVILAMGAEPKRLGIPGEVELAGRGVSTCGVCDGAFFKGEKVIVIGGGDSAMEDSIFISKFASELAIVHRRDEFRASKIMVERAREQDNISFKTPYVPEEFIAGGGGKLATARLRHATTGEAEDLEVGGAFVAIGHTPRSELVRDQVEIDEGGYVLTRDGSTRTNLGGVFAVGDLPSSRHRGGHRVHGGAGRGVVPARSPAVAGGPLGRQGRPGSSGAGRGRARSRQLAPIRQGRGRVLTVRVAGCSSIRVLRALLELSDSRSRSSGSPVETRQ